MQMTKSLTIVPPERTPIWLQWGVYPLSWAVAIILFAVAVQGHIQMTTALILSNATLVVLLIVLETLFPFRRRWGATWSSVFTDIKYIAMNGAFLGLAKAVLGLYAIDISGDSVGPASEWPVWLQLVAALLIFEAFQYTVHRFMHEGSGRLGSLFWRLHSAHHLPEKLYVTMHAVGHPLNGLAIQTFCIVVPVWWMGYGETAVTLFLMINAIHGLIAHFNVDTRMGWFNYIFVGTELHRYHHSSALKDAKNFGAVLSVYDQIFGTFVYKPGRAPEELGAFNRTGYPDYQDIVQSLIFPFRRYF